MRRIWYAVCLSMVVAVALLGPGASSQASQPLCGTDALRVVSFGGEGASGQFFAYLRFELRRPGHCMLRGYPGVTLFSGHHRLNIHVGRYPYGLPRSVLLDAHHPAYFDLVFRPATPAGGPCPIRVTALRIIPPNQRRALSVKVHPKPLSVCADGPPLVKPVRSTRLP